MSKGSSSNRWRRRQARDEFVRRARSEGWRSRAVYKLMEIQQRDRLIRSGDTVLDVGAAPGSWSQYAASVVGASGRVVAVDLLAIQPIPGVDCIQGDFGDESILAQVLETLDGQPVDLVISDMAPNISGNRSVDQPRVMYLADIALDVARRALKPGGAFVVKLFHGEGFDDFVRQARAMFETVRVRKPGASRARSPETYLVARNYRL